MSSPRHVGGVGVGRALESHNGGLKGTWSPYGFGQSSPHDLAFGVELGSRRYFYHINMCDHLIYKLKLLDITSFYLLNYILNTPPRV